MSASSTGSGADVRVTGLGKRGHLIAAYDAQTGRAGLSITDGSGTEVRVVLTVDELQMFAHDALALAHTAAPPAPAALEVLEEAVRTVAQADEQAMALGRHAAAIA